MVVSLVLIAAAVASPTPSVPIAAPAGGTVQQAFDRASHRVEARDYAGALADYEALERRFKPGAKSLPLVLMRKGEVLLYLDRPEEAIGALRGGLAGAAGNSTIPALETMAAMATLGSALEARLDLAAARTLYEALVAKAGKAFPNTRLTGLAGVARTAMFDDAPAALAAADEVTREMTARATDPSDRASIGQATTLRGRILLNMGRFSEAMTELRGSVQKLGGLTARIDRADVMARSDMAIASLLAGKEDTARQYMAYTGAGTNTEVLPALAGGSLPACGEDGIQPNDVAVIQFTITTAGETLDILPIYASRQGPVALAFARAVRDWRWPPDGIARIKPFFRSLVRLELRCTASLPRPNLMQSLRFAVIEWLVDRKVAPLGRPAGRTAIEQLAAVNVELARREAAHGARSPALVEPLVVIATSITAGREAAEAAARRAHAIAVADNAPGAARAQLALNSVLFMKEGEAGSFLASELAAPSIARDPQARAALGLWRSDLAFYNRRSATARPLLQAIADDQALTPRDPLKVAALVRLASLELGSGNVGAARTAYERTGLDAQQCALLDMRPAITAGGPRTATFPMAALRWGFEGWVRTELDVTAAGAAQNVRVVTAYPPFVFSETTEDAMSRAHFQQTYRPEGALGCGGLQQTVRYQIPVKRGK